MALHFGKKPPTSRVFIRVQAIGADGRPTKTQSISMWEMNYDEVLALIVKTCEQYGSDVPDYDAADPVEQGPPIKGRMKKGHRA